MRIVPARVAATVAAAAIAFGGIAAAAPAAAPAEAATSGHGKIILVHANHQSLFWLEHHQGYRLARARDLANETRDRVYRHGISIHARLTGWVFIVS